MATLGMSDDERESVERFEANVMAPSMTELVILDFWAEWCGPCKQLAPILDKIAADYADRGVRVVKIDVDSEKALAAQFRIQSIPTIYAIYKGQPVADLTNYRTEGQLTKVVDELLRQLRIAPKEGAPKADVEPLLALGEQTLENGDAQQAVAVFRQIVDIVPDHPAAVGGLVRALVAAGDHDGARQVLDDLAEKLADKPEIARARAALDIATRGPAIDTSQIEERLAEDPSDHSARFDLAQALMAGGKRDEAADALLAIVAADREWDEGAARTAFLRLLEAQGLEDPWSRAQRRRLSALLFT